FPRKFYFAFLKITFVRLGNNNAYLPLRAFRNADRTQVTDNLSSARTFLLHCRNGQICEAVGRNNLKSVTMKILYYFLFLLSFKLSAQVFNSNIPPNIETYGVADTLVTPDRIYLQINLQEKDTKGKVSVEELEEKMINYLKSINIDLKKNLVLKDVSSNFRKYFLKQQDVQKVKNYQLLVFDAKTVALVLVGLEEIGISNVTLDRTEYSKIDSLRTTLKVKALKKAKNEAQLLASSINQKIGEALYISTQNFDGGGTQLQEVVVMGYRKGKKYEPADIEIEPVKISSFVTARFKL